MTEWRMQQNPGGDDQGGPQPPPWKEGDDPGKGEQPDNGGEDEE